MTKQRRIAVFGPFRLCSATGDLIRHGHEIRVPRQSLLLLEVFVDRPGETVSCTDLAHILWPDKPLSDVEVGLAAAVSSLRGRLSDIPSKPRFVKTIKGVGYRFIAPVEWERPQETDDGADPSISIARERFGLAAWSFGLGRMVGGTVAGALAAGICVAAALES